MTGRLVHKTGLIVLGLGALTPGTSPTVESIAFTVEAGTNSTKRFEYSGSFETALVDIGVSGMEIEIPEIELTAEWTRTIVVEDEYRAMREGAPQELARSFETIEHGLETSMDVDGSALVYQEEDEPDCETELEGTTVLFVWDEDAEVYETSFVDEEEAEVELLAGLTEDMDLRALLPDEEVEPGDEWEIEPAAFLSALLPGGDLGIVYGRGESDRGPELPAGGLDPRLAGGPEVFVGEATDDSEAQATLLELREVDGVRMAVIALSAELETRSDRMELFEEWMEDYGPDEQGIVVEIEEASVTFEGELTGELLWNLDAGRAHSLELTCDAMLTLVRSAAVDADGQDVAIELELEMEGELTLSASFE